jgi:hypothetical protein
VLASVGLSPGSCLPALVALVDRASERTIRAKPPRLGPLA